MRIKLESKRPDRSGTLPGQERRWSVGTIWAMRMALLGLVIATGCLENAAIAQGLFSAKVKGGFIVPELDDQNRTNSILRGDEATSITTTLFQIKGLKIDTYQKGSNAAQDHLAWIVKSPECQFDYKTRMATSTNRLEVQSANAQFVLSGVGFQWRQADSYLTISNKVITMLYLARKRNPTNNAPAGMDRQDLEITSEHFEFSSKKSEAIYTGNVRIREVDKETSQGPPVRMGCEKLTVNMRLGGGGLDSIVAESSVTFEQGENRGKSDKAIYTATNDVVHLIGEKELAFWHTPQAEGQGDLLILERKADRFIAQGHTASRLFGAANQGFYSFSTSSTASRPSTNSPIQIFADTLTAQLTPTNQAVESVVAEKQVRILHRGNQLEGDRAVYKVRGTNDLSINMDGNTRWHTPEGEGRADNIVYTRPDNMVKANGNGWLKLHHAAAKTNALIPSAEAMSVEITSDQYQWSSNEVNFVGKVHTATPQYLLDCAELAVFLSSSNTVRLIKANKDVQVQQKPLPGARPGEPLWHWTAEEMNFYMQPTGVQIDRIEASRQVNARQWMDMPKRGRQARIELTCDQANIGMAEKTGQLEKVAAQNNVKVVQRGDYTNGGFGVTWTLKCMDLQMDVADNGNRIQKALAQQKVTIEQSGESIAPEPPWLMRCQELHLDMLPNTNVVSRVDARRDVSIEQGPNWGYSDRAVYWGVSNIVEMIGKPFVHAVDRRKVTVEKPGTPAEEHQAVEVQSTEVLIWDRGAGRLRGIGISQITPLKPANPSVEKP